jgi:hypothetical protein
MRCGLGKKRKADSFYHGSGIASRKLFVSKSGDSRDKALPQSVFGKMRDIRHFLKDISHGMEDNSRAEFECLPQPGDAWFRWTF